MNSQNQKLNTYFIRAHNRLPETICCTQYTIPPGIPFHWNFFISYYFCWCCCLSQHQPQPSSIRRLAQHHSTSKTRCSSVRKHSFKIKEKSIYILVISLLFLIFYLFYCLEHLTPTLTGWVQERSEIKKNFNSKRNHCALSQHAVCNQWDSFSRMWLQRARNVQLLEVEKINRESRIWERKMQVDQSPCMTHTQAEIWLDRRSPQRVEFPTSIFSFSPTLSIFTHMLITLISQCCPIALLCCC